MQIWYSWPDHLFEYKAYKTRIQEEIIGEVQASTTEATAEDPALTTFDENNFENEEEIVIDGFLIEKPQDESGTVVCDWESTKPCLWSEFELLKTS